MRTSRYLLSTLKETPNDADVISHQLMLRSGMIRKLASGLYIWLPTGLRVLRKIEKIIREEMNNAGAIEISMPIVQPEFLWKKSGRWIKYGSELVRFSDRGKRPLVLGPTHEEVITQLICNEINSYKQLPIMFFQIQTKFRDEIRPRFGVIRSREFLMKDAYSFHINQDSLNETYNLMYQTYVAILTRMNLNFKVVQANTGAIGGHVSHEFHVLTCSGEDSIVFSTVSNYAANIDLVEAVVPSNFRKEPSEEIRLVDTPNINTITELVEKFNLSVKKIVKVFVVHARKETNNSLIALMIRGDHTLNKVKSEKIPQILLPLKFASNEEIQRTIHIPLNSLGPINLPIPLIIDRSVEIMSDFVAGSNIDGKHFFGINWGRDLPLPQVEDLRNIVNGDASPDGLGTLKIQRGIEVGHIFQLGKKYSETMKTVVQGENGLNQPVIMGCYGIGITRIIGATIEQKHDKRGILWPEELAPFNVAILPINMHKSTRVRNLSEKIYSQLCIHGIDVILDDRNEYLGIMFSDMELIGIPHFIIISERNIDTNKIEYRNRYKNEKKMIKLNTIVKFIINEISSGINKKFTNNVC